MSNKMRDFARGLFSLVVVVVNTAFWSSLLFLVAILKFAVPREGWRMWCTGVLSGIAQNWVGVNTWGLELTKRITWDVRGTENLNPNAWYLVVANHQSWVDIVVLQKIFHRRIPMLKFFLKRELIWVPLLGIAWWALDFPFLKRSSSTQKDFDTTLKACEKFKLAPVAVMIFLEGTRFTAKKHSEQNSAFNNLLKPKIGGIALVLSSMKEQLHSLLDVTIVYPQGVQNIWAFLCAKSMTVKVRVNQRPVDESLIGDYVNDRQMRRRLTSWVNAMWVDKDGLITELLEEADEGQSCRMN